MISCDLDALSGAIVDAAMSMLLADHAGGGKEPGKAEAEAEEEEGGVPEIDAGDGGGGYAAAYVQLSFAAAAEADIYASEEPSAALAAAVQALRAMQPALISALLRTFHEPSTNLPRTVQALGAMLPALLSALPTERQGALRQLMQRG